MLEGRSAQGAVTGPVSARISCIECRCNHVHKLLLGQRGFGLCKVQHLLSRSSADALFEQDHLACAYSGSGRFCLGQVIFAYVGWLVRFAWSAVVGSVDMRTALEGRA